MIGLGHGVNYRNDFRIRKDCSEGQIFEAQEALFVQSRIEMHNI